MGARIPVRRSRTATLARGLGALSLPVLVLTALLRRVGLVPPEMLAPLIALGIALALGAVVFGALALARIWHTGDRGAGSASLAIVFALPALLLLGLIAYGYATFPMLADVTTDLDDPPEFISVEPPPPPTLPADEAQLHRAAYPDITARLLPFDVDRTFDAAEELVRRRGWTVSLAAPPADMDSVARIEATAHTLLFQFPDVVSIRLTPTPEGGTRVDMRSVSRLAAADPDAPIHDLGQNARRIRSFLAELELALTTDALEESENRTPRGPPGVGLPQPAPAR